MTFRGFLLLLLSFPVYAAVGPTPWTSEPSAAVIWKAVEDDAGGFYLLWTRPEANATRVMAQHFTNDGVALWPTPGKSLLPVVGDSTSWTAFADSTHGLVTTWVQDAKVWAQAWSPDGQPRWQTPAKVSDPRFTVGSPTGIADGGGGTFLVWTEKSYADRSVLMAQHLNRDAVLLWPAALRVSLRPSDQRVPNVAFDGAAGLIISWADYRDFASDWRVQRLNYQGFRLWGLEGAVIASPVGSLRWALKIAPWGQGSFTAAWVSDQNNHNRIMDQQFSPKGQMLPDNRRSQPVTADQWNPTLTGDGEGHYWVGWEDNRDERNWQIYVRSGGADVPLAPATGDQGLLTLALDASHGLVGAWIDNRSGNASLFAQRLDSNGQPVWERSGREIASDLKHPGSPRLLALGGGRMALIWTQHPTRVQTLLYWQILP